MSKEKFKGFTHTHFVLCGEGLHKVNNGGSMTLMEGYSDHEGVVTGEKGKYVKYVTSRDSRGRDVAKRFRFDINLRRLLVRDSDKDFYGLTQYTWLKNYPSCEGSPYGEYVRNRDTGEMEQIGVLFRELNTERDAQVALEADELRVKAQSEVLSLDDETLDEIAAILGHHTDAGKVKKLKVLEYAGKRPKDFFEMMNSGDRAVRAIVRKALAESIFTKKGSVIMWETTVLGADEDDAIAKLVKDPDLLKGLQEKLGVSKQVEAKRKPGNPNFGKQKSKD